MKHCTRILTILLAMVIIGCTTTNKETGQKEYDPVKTAKVTAAIKGLAATTVTVVIDKNPEAKVPFEQAAINICTIRDAGQVTLVGFKESINAAFRDYPQRTDPLVAGAINTLIVVFEVNFADRLRADVPEEKFVWHLLDVFCDGINQGLEFSSTPDEN